jgi:hypothetical protein
MKKSWILLVILIPLVIVFLYIEPIPIINGGDWIYAFRPAALALLQGLTPYGDIGTGFQFYNPPWALIPFIPLVLLPVKISSLLMFISGFVAYSVILYKMKARPLTSLFFMTSLPILADLQYGNITWMALLGYLMPPQIGLFFVLMKPQIGAAVALYWLIEAWHRGKIREVIRVFLPVTIAIALSIIIFGPWYQTTSTVIGVDANVSLFPASISIGLVLMTLAIQRRNIKLSYMVSPFLSPYICWNGYSTVLLGLVSSTTLTAVASIGYWITIFIMAGIKG